MKISPLVLSLLFASSNAMRIKDAPVATKPVATAPAATTVAPANTTAPVAPATTTVPPANATPATFTQTAANVEHLGQDCWGGCKAKQGKCDWCGTGGICCRSGWKDKSNGCDGILGMKGKGHVCVKDDNAPSCETKLHSSEGWCDPWDYGHKKFNVETPNDCANLHKERPCEYVSHDPKNKGCVCCVGTPKKYVGGGYKTYFITNKKECSPAEDAKEEPADDAKEEPAEEEKKAEANLGKYFASKKRAPQDNGKYFISNKAHPDLRMTLNDREKSVTLLGDRILPIQVMHLVEAEEVDESCPCSGGWPCVKPDGKCSGTGRAETSD
jgi:hypothetical protein